MKNIIFSELLCRFWSRVRGRVKHEKTRFVCDIRYFVGGYVRCSTNALEKWENFETRKRARRTFVHNLCAFCGRVHGFAECKGVGVVLRRLTNRGEGL